MNKYIDHTLLKANATLKDILELCEQAKDYNFKTVCINGAWVKAASTALCHSEVEVCAVIGFPLGANSTQVKVFEAKQAIADGANEIDMVINIGKLIENDIAYVENEIAEIKAAINDHVLKVIIETALLTDEQKVAATQAVVNAKADFVKTSTGFSTAGATVADVKLLASVAHPTVKVKAAGGVKSKADFEAMIAAGADRIGTSSGIALLKDESISSGY